MKTIHSIFLILLSILAFLISLSIYFKYIELGKKYMNLEQGKKSFLILYSTIEDVCRRFTGEKRIIVLYLPQESKIYGYSNILCYRDFDTMCKELTCTINRFEISNKSFIKEFFINKLAKVEVTIEKTNYGFINITYRPII